MAEIKIFTDNIDKKMTKIKSIYKAFGLRYDVREARKFLIHSFSRSGYYCFIYDWLSYFLEL